MEWMYYVLFACFFVVGFCSGMLVEMKFFKTKLTAKIKGSDIMLVSNRKINFVKEYEE